MSNKDWGGTDKIWNSIRRPLVPCDSDLALIFDACGPDLLARQSARVLVLGVTPALVRAPWPAGFEICAVDFDPKMIKALWPEHPAGQSRIVCADWKSMPFPDDHFDLVIGDCSFCALPSLLDYRDVLAEVMRVKRSNAPIITRFFMQPETRLSLRELPKMVKVAPFSNFSPSEIRLLVGIAASGDDAVVKFDQIPQRVADEWGDFEAYIAALGQSGADAERTKATFSLRHQLNYPCLQQISEQFSAFGLALQLREPDYPSGHFCPTICFG